MEESITSQKPRILCLHGFRTSGEILSRQMAAMRCHVFANFEYITAPFPATGDPDRGIQQYYPDKDYYEWYTLDKGDDRNWQISQSVDRVMSEVAMNGPFDGILGFSQGCAMAMRVLLQLQREQLRPFKFAVFLGGVTPDGSEQGEDFMSLRLPSLHVMGDHDFVLQRSIALRDQWCASASTHTLTFDGGHHIPPLRAGLYPEISKWIQKYCSDATEL